MFVGVRGELLILERDERERERDGERERRRERDGERETERERERQRDEYTYVAGAGIGIGIGIAARGVDPGGSPVVVGRVMCVGVYVYVDVLWGRKCRRQPCG